MSSASPRAARPSEARGRVRVGPRAERRRAARDKVGELVDRDRARVVVVEPLDERRDVLVGQVRRRDLELLADEPLELGRAERAVARLVEAREQLGRRRAVGRGLQAWTGACRPSRATCLLLALLRRGLGLGGRELGRILEPLAPLEPRSPRSDPGPDPNVAAPRATKSASSSIRPSPSRRRRAT